MPELLLDHVDRQALGRELGGSDLRDLVEPLMEQVIEARTEAAGLQAQVRLLEERAQSTRERDELLASLVSSSWRERRRARRSALATLTRQTG